VAQRLAHSQQAVAFAGLKRLALSCAPSNDLKAGLLSFDFKLLDGRTVDHTENKRPQRGPGPSTKVFEPNGARSHNTPSPDDAAGST
jgi:hypothetical protein